MIRFSVFPFCILLSLSACGSGSSDGIDPTTATCESLKKNVIEMSSESDPKILELDEIKTFRAATAGDPSASCAANAITSKGTHYLEYDSSVSAEGKVLLSLKYPNGTN